MHRRLILIIEDSRTDVFLMREAVETAQINASIEVVHDGQSATRYIDTVDMTKDEPCPDRILLDINLPRKSGDEVLRHLRSSARCRWIKVLIVSSSDAPKGHAVIQNLAVAGYFRKPSNYAEHMKLGPLFRNLL